LLIEEGAMESIFLQIEDYMAPLGILLLLVGGLVLILSGIDTHSEALTQRIDKLQLLRSDKAAASKQGRMVTEERHRPLPAQGLTPAEQAEIVRLLAPAGVRASRALWIFTLVRLLSLAVFIMGAIWSPWGAEGGIKFLLAIVGAAIVGWLAPLNAVRFTLRRHRRAVAEGLPDSLELLAVCVEAGLSLENALQRVARELAASHPALATELSLTWAEIIILPSRDQALMNLADRVDLPSVRSVVSTLAQTMRFGTPLSQSLRVVAADLRNDQMIRLEERANKLPALMTIPVMLFILPTIFMVVGGPAVLKLMDTFH
jgi:tight adherence protein C